MTKLLLSLSKYRAETMGPLTESVNQLMNQKAQDNRVSMAVNSSETSQEGVLGARPTNLTSVAELMLHDTNTNVYEATKLTYI